MESSGVPEGLGIKMVTQAAAEAALAVYWELRAQR
jgi:hypothetical protein